MKARLKRSHSILPKFRRSVRSSRGDGRSMKRQDNILIWAAHILERWTCRVPSLGVQISWDVIYTRQNLTGQILKELISRPRTYNRRIYEKLFYREPIYVMLMCHRLIFRKRKCKQRFWKTLT